MKHFYYLIFLAFPLLGYSQVSLDTLAIQDFENSPSSPEWTYTGTFNDLQSGTAPAGSCIPGTPLGIGNSQSWHVVSVSGGNTINFDNLIIPSGYDSVRVNFNLAALNLNSSSGGPDDLDYVLVEYSLDNGNSWVSRLRIRGALSNNSFWPYSASGEAKVQHTPTTEALFQPTNSGLQDAEGYSFCEIAFPGSITQVAIRITPRSSSSTDSWLIDNLVITGENSCTPTSSNITEQACDSYTAPSGAVYNSTGVITDVIPNSTGCDSTITIDLTVNNSETGTDLINSCGDYTWIDGNTYTSNNNTATFVLNTVAGCDSVVTLDLTINPTPNNSVTQNGTTLTADESGAQYQWLDCENNFAVISGASNQSFTPEETGNFAVEITQNNCSDTSSCFMIDFTSLSEVDRALISIYPNPAIDEVVIVVEKTTTMRMYGIQGQLVMEKQLQKGLNTIEVNHLNAGVYLLNVESGYYSKLIKE